MYGVNRIQRSSASIFAVVFTLSLIVNCIAPSPVYAQASGATRVDYKSAFEVLERFVAHEMADKDLPAVSIALVEDQQIVWSKGFGFADPVKKIPATAETVYRVGSVSKLFTDIAIMQLVEQGKLDLDAPVTRYLSDFRPRNPFGKAITLRQLMSHRSGLVREPPVGNYFETTEPSLARTIESLNQTSLVYAPESRIKYSNAAIATVGYVLEKMQKNRSQNTSNARCLIGPVSITAVSNRLPHSQKISPRRICGPSMAAFLKLRSLSSE